MTLDELNALPAPEAEAAFRRCCGSAAWAAAMAAARPFASLAAMTERANALWDALGRDDRLEAFAAHPRIGDLDRLRRKYAATADWSSREQGGVAGAPDAVLERLASGNRAYEARFGYLFLVCATGKSAAELADLLDQRLANDPDTEWTVACAEQAKIMTLRLEKLLA